MAGVVPGERWGGVAIQSYVCSVNGYATEHHVHVCTAVSTKDPLIFVSPAPVKLDEVAVSRPKSISQLDDDMSACTMYFLAPYSPTPSDLMDRLCSTRSAEPSVKAEGNASGDHLWLSYPALGGPAYRTLSWLAQEQGCTCSARSCKGCTIAERPEYININVWGQEAC